jgi:hypothetical protein
MSKEPAISPKGDVRQILTTLHEISSKTLTTSLDRKFDPQNNRSYALASDLDIWAKILEGRREHILYASATREYVLALLSNCQGHYRNGFKGLRLALELILQGAYLSANLVALSEWLSNLRDTTWATIVDRESGVLSRNFCRAFCPELSDQSAQPPHQATSTPATPQG